MTGAALPPSHAVSPQCRSDWWSWKRPENGIVHRHLHEAGYDVAVVNSYRSRKLADAMGHLAKSDAIDARTLALFGEALRPRTTPPPPDVIVTLRELVVARRACIAERTALKNRLERAQLRLVSRQFQARIKALQRHIKVLQTAAPARLAPISGPHQGAATPYQSPPNGNRRDQRQRSRLGPPVRYPHLHPRDRTCRRNHHDRRTQ